MYRCSKCGNIFENFNEIIIPGGCYEADYGVYSLFPDHHYYPSYTYLGCPECEVSYEECKELKPCDICDKLCEIDDLFDTTQMINGGVGDVCEQCLEDYDIGGYL